MHKQFSQSLVGYDPLHVDSTLQSMKESHQAELERSRKRLTLLAEQSASLQETIEQLRQQLSRYRSREDVADKLLPVYLQAVARLLVTRLDVSETEQALEQRIAQKQSQLRELRDCLTEMPCTVRAIASRYQTIMRAEEKD